MRRTNNPSAPLPAVPAVVPAPSPDPNVKLTDRQARILAWIRTYSDRHGYMPTVREIGAAFGIGSTNGVARHLAALEKKGYLRRAGRYTSRALVLAPPAACAPPSLN